MEFHISRKSRDRYQFDQTLFSLNGNVIFANFHAVRLLAQKLNQKRDLISFPERAAKAGEINGMGLIDEILHLVVAIYREKLAPTVFKDAHNHLAQSMGDAELERLLVNFTAEFPPVAVYRNEQSVAEYLKETTGGISNKEIALEELILLWVNNANPALEPYRELFDDSSLAEETAYSRAIISLYEYFKTQPSFGPKSQNILDMLRSPAIASPYSIPGQLEYIRQNWAEILGQYLYRLLTSLDLIKEEMKDRFMGGQGVIPVPVYDLAQGENEPERFSADSDWMPRLVLIAKNTYVWLDQLSKKYCRKIQRLDQVPDEELDMFARWGFTGLWLIGLWERSHASARIKQMCGNPDAISSAYSIYQYRIADDLGGEAAYHNLNERAARRNIRLASDMVPNHMAIDSPWVVDHPNWFISLDHPPFPAYAFSGADLSPDANIRIQLEDHYYNRTDAAVVFKREDVHTGSTRYIYHGNDGTSMPWNDTAQLNYLDGEVREAIIQTILDVARRFRIIRFDAAMTLTKKHYQRLWFPEPGSGGDIPSRAEHGMTKQQFNNAMPEEFWREVVDRIKEEAPDTLLLAEAFWLMESYFVRTLGMHRVYNSAFMNMLRNEDNSRYRLLMKNTLEFDPEILKRYVNFMNNPDERTAVDQFGTGDKYFGICVLMATLPGLPMFGHGQVEGFHEKYGMEFRKAYHDEQVDTGLVHRHQRQIFPLLHRRTDFAGVEHFLLYDVFSASGQVIEDVFAYTNGKAEQRSLVLYHNRFATATGWIQYSAAYASKDQSGDRRVEQRKITDALQINPAVNNYLIYRDQISGLEYIRSCKEIHNEGWQVDLGAYETHVFHDFRQVEDDEWNNYQHLNDLLGGRGVPSIAEAKKELSLSPVIKPYRQLVNAGYFEYLWQQSKTPLTNAQSKILEDETARRYSDFLSGIQNITGSTIDQSTLLSVMRVRFRNLMKMSSRRKQSKKSKSEYMTVLRSVASLLTESRETWFLMLGLIFTADIGMLSGSSDETMQTQSWMEEWTLARILEETYQELFGDGMIAGQVAVKVKLLVGHFDWYQSARVQRLRMIIMKLLQDPNTQSWLRVNRYQDILYYNKEAMLEFTELLLLLAAFHQASDITRPDSRAMEALIGASEVIEQLRLIDKRSKFQVQNLLDLAGSS